MEPVVFRERFYGWTDDDIEIHGNKVSPCPPSLPLR